MLLDRYTSARSWKTWGLWCFLCALWLGSLGMATRADAAPERRAAPPARPANARPAGQTDARKAPADARKAPADRPTKAPSAVRKAPAQEQFKAVDLSKRKADPNWDRPYLLVAYGIVWLVLFFYMLSLARRVSRTDEQLARLEQQVQDLVDEEEESA